MSLILWAITFLLLGSFAYAGYIGAPWVPTKHHERKRLLELVSVEPNDVVYDLGCGNGAVLFDFAVRYPAGQYIGYELSLGPLLYALIKKTLHSRRYARVSLRFGNAYRQDLSNADIVFIYLLEQNYHRLVPALSASRINPDALIIVEGWPLPNTSHHFSNNQPGYLPLYFYRGRDFQH